MTCASGYGYSGSASAISCQSNAAWTISTGCTGSTNQSNCASSSFPANSGWTLVRRTPGNMHQASDRLCGTEMYGTPNSSPTGGAAFSVNFENTVPGYNEFLFATGNCNYWMVFKKKTIWGSSSCNAVSVDGSYVRCERSILGASPYLSQVYRRLYCCPEDPWVQPESGHSQATALHCEANYNANGGGGRGAYNQGLNVYIRSNPVFAVCLFICLFVYFCWW